MQNVTEITQIQYNYTTQSSLLRHYKLYKLFIWYIGCFNRILIFLLQLFEESIINQNVVLKTKDPEKKTFV